MNKNNEQKKKHHNKDKKWKKEKYNITITNAMQTPHQTKKKK